MQNVPKIVTQRLGVPAKAGKHPDPDLLAAFAEQALPQRERSSILEHLARCADCRDIVALALPETATQLPVIDTGRTWFAWPTLRWAFVAAGIVAIGSLGVLRYQHNSQSNVAELRSPAAQTFSAEQKQDDKTSANSEAAKPNQLTFFRNAPAADKVAVKRVPTVDRAPAAITSPLPSRTGGPAPKNLNHMQWQQQGAVQSQVAPSAQNALSSNAVSQDLVVRNGSADQLRDSPAMSRAKPVVTGSAAGAPATAPVPAAARALQQQSFAQASTLPQWNINAAGTLQRSFDQGATWQDVTILADSLPKANFAQVQAAGKAAAAKEAQSANVLDTRSATPPSAPPSPLFRVLAVNGADVWAGGANSLLYHSADAGGHWARVIPASASSTMSGDVVALDFPDAQHGTIRTSSSEVWITSDGGQSWSKQ